MSKALYLWREKEVGYGSPPFITQMKHHVPGSGHGAFLLCGAPSL